jgi:hypothetical protein
MAGLDRPLRYWGITPEQYGCMAAARYWTFSPSFFTTSAHFFSSLSMSAA